MPSPVIVTIPRPDPSNETCLISIRAHQWVKNKKDNLYYATIPHTMDFRSEAAIVLVYLEEYIQYLKTLDWHIGPLIHPRVIHNLHSFTLVHEDPADCCIMAWTQQYFRDMQALKDLLAQGINPYEHMLNCNYA